MSPAHKVGDPVTILGPYDRDPVVVGLQRYGSVAEVVNGEAGTGYTVELDATWPPGERFGPFPEARLAKGWSAR